jgi:hypothetical protein
MTEPKLVVRRDVEIGAWIRSRLGPFGGHVGSVVPRGFPSYARILHAVETPSRRWRWADIARTTGRIVHPTAQWHRVADREYDDGDYTNLPSGNPPTEGCLDRTSQLALIEVLRRHSPAGADWLLGVWEGWGWLHPGRNFAFAHREGSAPDPPQDPGPPFGADALDGPLLQHPQRNYLLLSGPPDAVPSLGYHPTPNRFIPWTAGLMWPSDRSWCVATEVDFDSTLVGGSESLVADILAAFDLEAWPISPDDDLTIHGDHVNT